MFDLFREITTTRPYSTAILDREGGITYGELLALVSQIGAAISRGVPRGEPVAIALPITRYYPAAMLGALASGHPYVPLDIGFPAARLGQILTHSGARAVVGDQATLTSLAELFPIDLPVIDVERPECNKTIWSATGCADDIAYIIYTSGSTGQPKGVYQDQRGLLHDIMQYTNSVHLAAGDRCTLLYSPSVSGAIRDIYGALLNGATLCMLDLKRDGLTGAAERLGQWEVTLFHAMPPVLRSLLRHMHDTSVLAQIRLAYLAGDRLFPSDVRLFRAAFPDDCLLYTGIGSTECATLYRQWFVPTNWPLDQGLLPVGSALPERELEILTEDGSEAPPGVAGEIVVRGRYLARGYWWDPESTRTAFRADPEDPSVTVFRTGDRGRLRHDGLLEFIGRTDRQIKIRGYRVEPTEIESVMRDIPSVAEAVVLPQEHHGGIRLIAYLQMLDHDPGALEAANAILAERLPAHSRPAVLIPLETLPRLGNFKVDLNALRARLERDLPVSDTEGHLAATKPAKDDKTLSALVVTAWGRVLGLQRVQMDQSWETAGGDSLKTLELMVALERTWNVRLPADLLDTRMTPRQLTARLARHFSLDSTYHSTTPTNTGVLFIIPGIAGAGIQLKHLAERFAPTFQTEILDFPDLEEELRQVHSITELAERCLAEITLRISPSTPILLLGVSYGSRVAFELAVRLHGSGYSIAMLAIGDIPVTSGFHLVELEARDTLKKRERNGLATLKKRIKHAYRDFVIVLANRRQQGVLRIMTRIGRAIFGPYFAAATLNTIRRASIPSWEPPYHPGRAVLLLTDHTADRLERHSIDIGWDKYCDHLQIIRLEGDHGNYIMPPNEASFVSAVLTAANIEMQCGTRE